MQKNILDSVKLPEYLSSQLDKTITQQSLLCGGRVEDSASHERVMLNFKWAHKLALLHYKSRIMRATDLDSKEVAKAQEIARKYIGAGNHDFFATCVDGRNMPTVMFSKPPHVGGVLRSPAGILSGFMASQQRGSVFIDYSTFVVQQLSKLLQEKAGDTIFYGLDSHLSCAARGQIHETEGGRQKDGGTRSDVLSKLMMARGILRLRAELLKQGKSVAEVIPTFFSFDPYSGGVWFGLEAYAHRPDVAANGFTADLLDKMLKDGLVISSFDLLSDDFVLSSLSAVLKANSADFRFAYARSLQTNWLATEQLYDRGQSEFFKYLLQKMTAIYQRAGWMIGESDSFDQQSISERTIRQKTKFLLKNLVTRYSIAGVDKKWPYDGHQEEMVVITDGGYAPFPATDAFAVFSRDLNGLLLNTKLTVDLVRNSRRQNKIQNPFPEISLSTADFVAAPVIVSNKAIVKGLRQQDWQALSTTGLEDIFVKLNWDDETILDWRKSDIAKLLLKIVDHKKVSLDLSGSLRLIDGIYELFDHVRILMKDKYFRQMMLAGNVLVLSSIVDHNRLPRIIFNVPV